MASSPTFSRASWRCSSHVPGPGGSLMLWCRYGEQPVGCTGSGGYHEGVGPVSFPDLVGGWDSEELPHPGGEAFDSGREAGAHDCDRVVLRVLPLAYGAAHGLLPRVGVGGAVVVLPVLQAIPAEVPGVIVAAAWAGVRVSVRSVWHSRLSPGRFSRRRGCFRHRLG